MFLHRNKNNNNNQGVFLELLVAANYTIEWDLHNNQLKGKQTSESTDGKTVNCTAREAGQDIKHPDLHAR